MGCTGLVEGCKASILWRGRGFSPSGGSHRAARVKIRAEASESYIQFKSHFCSSWFICLISRCARCNWEGRRSRSEGRRGLSVRLCNSTRVGISERTLLGRRRELRQHARISILPQGSRGRLCCSHVTTGLRCRNFYDGL